MTDESKEQNPAATEERLENVDIANGPPAENETADRLRVAEEEIEKLKDAWTRERAEFMNYKKRAGQEAARSRQHDMSRFVGGFLPALDSLDRVCSMQSDVEAVKNFLEGVEMVRQEFLRVLIAHNVKCVIPMNESFDPRHGQPQAPAWWACCTSWTSPQSACTSVTTIACWARSSTCVISATR